MIGIYSIRNTKNNKRYIGQSRNIKTRWQKHIWSLNNGNHKNGYLQNAWNKNGQENFEFTIIEESEVDELNDLEIYYIKKYNTFEDREKGYNLTSGGDSGTHSLESRRKMSEAHQGDKNPMYGVEPWNKGNQCPPETRAKISESLTGRTLPPEHIEKLREASTGRKHKLESKVKVSKNKKNTTGIFRVTKRKDSKCLKGFKYVYRYQLDDKRKEINNVDILKLKERVIKKGLDWIVLDEDNAQRTFNESNGVIS